MFWVSSKNVILLLLSGVFCKCQLGQVVQVFYILTDFLLLILLIIVKGGVEISIIEYLFLLICSSIGFYFTHFEDILTERDHK